ncbi:MAG: hypothetical protein A2W22_01260 [Candidatus Levybacteria bacterium RBG_16_35_11]|nr:MAG: hypothetical protein A2W22_01260 [Candidatus Levybacteria bacterium RBG_16_35_11]
MRYSELFGKTSRDFPKEEVAKNAKLLLRAGFIDKLMAGSYTLLPLGFRVKEKIENIIREEMDKTGAEEILMPLMHPKQIWNETKRWEYAKDVMYQFKKDDKEYALSFTHEEVVLDIVRKRLSSYKDLPIKLYHFSTKFRNELRAKSGILRAREFLMKDLYSLHASKEDLDKYYFKVAEVYIKIFERLGLKARMVEAPGGVFTENITHEFQVLAENGEDSIFYCEKCDFGQNKEIAKVKKGDKCPKCGGLIKEGRSIEVGNIFPLGTIYSEKMGIYFADKKGEKKLAWFACYGIGTTRVIGALVEVLSDEKGIVWPKEVSPYEVHLVGLNHKAEGVYEKLKGNKVDVLFDDRDISAGEKFADCDLIGIPIRLIVSDNTQDKIEWKERIGEKTELLTIDEVLTRLH